MKIKFAYEILSFILLPITSKLKIPPISLYRLHTKRFYQNKVESKQTVVIYSKGHHARWP